MKSAEYVGAVTAAYRRVIDGLAGDREAAVREGLALLVNDFARKKTGYFFDHSAANPAGEIDWLNPEQDGGTGIALGTLLRIQGAGESRRGLIAAGAVLPGVGDSVRLHRRNDSERKTHKIGAVTDAGPGRWISIPEGFEPGDSVYLIQTRGMSARYPPIIPRDLENCRRTPGRDNAPDLSLPPLKRRDRPFPEGIYAAVSRPEELYIVQSVRPVRVLLGYSRLTARRLLADDGQALPFNAGEIIIALDPFFPQSMDGDLEEDIGRLRERGYHQFVLNNPGHYSYFRASGPKEKPADLIAGPYLYTFNRWALSFISSLGTDSFISPLENNRQNLERTVETGRRGSAFITVFAYPALFRIRQDLQGMYGFRKMEDNRGEVFRLLHGAEGSLVVPERPFSIIDKIPFLKEAGFRRFILDFSGPPLRKKDYKDIMAALGSGYPLPNTSRFNWKDWFYHEEKVGPPSPSSLLHL
jgi:putative protease